MSAPPLYSDATWERLLERFAGGESLKEICDSHDPEMPEVSTVFTKKRSDALFAKRFDEAEEDHARAKLLEVYDIADDVQGVASGDTQRDTLRVNARIKVAERLLTRYSNRSTVVTEDADGKKPIGVVAVPVKTLPTGSITVDEDVTDDDSAD